MLKPIEFMIGILCQHQSISWMYMVTLLRIEDFPTDRHPTWEVRDGETSHRGKPFSGAQTGPRALRNHFP